MAAAAALIAPLVIFARRSSLGHYGGEQTEVQPVNRDELVVALAGDSTDNAVLERAIQVATQSCQPVRVLHVRTFEALAEGALDTESLARSEQLVSAARARLEQAGLSASVEVLESAAVHLTTRILEQIEHLKPASVILGRGPERTLAHILHGSLVDGLNRRAGADIELMVVPAAGH